MVLGGELMEKKRFTTYLAAELILWLKHRAIEEGCSSAEIIGRLVSEYREKVEKSHR